MGSSRRRKSGAAHPDRQPDHEGNVSASDLVTGVAWYRRDQWSRLRELASDRDKLDDSYDQWLAGAQKALLVWIIHEGDSLVVRPPHPALSPAAGERDENTLATPLSPFSSLSPTGGEGRVRGSDVRA